MKEMDLNRALEILQECASMGMGYGNEAFSVVKEALEKKTMMEKKLTKIMGIVQALYEKEFPFGTLHLGE